MGEGYRLCGALPGGRRHRRIAHPGRTACTHHDHPGHRRPAHGPTQRHHSAIASSRDARLGVADLLGQDRYADAHGDDGGFRRHGRVSVSGHWRWLFSRGGNQKGRTARGQGPGTRADGTSVPALQRRGTVPGGWRLEGGGRSDRGRALSVRGQARHASAGRAGSISAYRRHSVRIRAQVHGDAPENCRWRAGPARQRRPRSHP